MQIDLKRFHETFFEEAEEHLGTIEAGLLSLTEQGADPELLNTIFRSAHSIKGAAGSFGFNELARLTHVMENVLDRLRSGKRQPAEALTQRYSGIKFKSYEPFGSRRTAAQYDAMAKEVDAVIFGVGD